MFFPPPLKSVMGLPALVFRSPRSFLIIRKVNIEVLCFLAFLYQKPQLEQA
jgi:hypothetical protein